MAVGVCITSTAPAAGPSITASTRAWKLVAAGAPLPLDVDIFARVNPAEKLALIRAHQAAGAVVAMTGDGVNDAPALRQADIGVAMGLRGTDVAREASAMVLLDDALATIVVAIREGRIIFANIRRFLVYLLSCNLSEILVIGLAVLAGMALPILPLQILFLNLVTDVFPAFALATGEGAGNVLEKPPRDPAEPILGRLQWRAVIVYGLVLTAAVFGALGLARGWLMLDAPQTITVTFLTLATAQLWHVLNMRPAGSSILSNDVTRNRWVGAALGLCSGLLLLAVYVPPLATVLHLTRPTLPVWVLVLVMSLIPALTGRYLLSAVERRFDGRR